MPERWGVGRAAGSVIKQRGQNEQKYLRRNFPPKKHKDLGCTFLVLPKIYICARQGFDREFSLGVIRQGLDREFSPGLNLLITS